MTKYKDGWHTIKGYDVYVENDCILRGTKGSDPCTRVSAYPYKLDKKSGSLINAVGVKVSTFAKSDLYRLE